jgi:opacity protein-like surface antigen
MTRKFLTPLASAVVLLVATASFAAGPTDPPRAYLSALGGVTFGSEAGGLVAAGINVVATSHLQIVGEFGRMSNVMPKTTSDEVNSVAEGFTGDGTVPFSFTATMPNTYGLGEVRVLGTQHNGLAPFVDGGFGFAKVTTHLTATQDGADVSDDFITAADLFQSQTKPMFTAGGGVSIAAGSRAVVDIGYHYSHIYTDTQAINTNRVFAGIRVGF